MFVCFSVICVEDTEHDSSTNDRIIGQYELSEYDTNGHPVWKRDSLYNFQSNTDWEIWFDTVTYFTWTIGIAPSQIIAYCNDTISPNPSDCSQWHQTPNTSPLFYESQSLQLNNGLCPTGNVSNYCIQSLSSDLDGLTGTYTQLIDGLPEWYYQDSDDDDAVVAVLHWTEIDSVIETHYGWTITVGQSIEAYCLFADEDVSITDPTECNEWLDASRQVDNSFDIDSNICEGDIVIDSNISLICLQHNSEIYSGVYKREFSSIIVANHRVWSMSVGNDIFSFLYYEIGDGWALTKNQNYLNNIEANNLNNFALIDDTDIIATCLDEMGLTDNPIACNNDWSIVEEFNLFAVTDSAECEIPIITTTIYPETTLLDDDDAESSGSQNEELLLGLGTTEYIGISAAVLVFPICILCFICYRKRRDDALTNNNGKDEHGIALQPYVPATMETNQKQRKTAPTSVTVASTSNPNVDDAENTLESTNALINVYDDDMAPQQGTLDNDYNPFMRDSIIRSGMTIDETKMSLNEQDIMSAFDE